MSNKNHNDDQDKIMDDSFSFFAEKLIKSILQSFWNGNIMQCISRFGNVFAYNNKKNMITQVMDKISLITNEFCFLVELLIKF